jgi:hypothetical protein
MKSVLYLAALCGVHGALNAAETAATATGRLVPQDADGVVWESAAGRAVRIKEPQLTLEDASDHARLPFKVELKNRAVRQGEAVLEYVVSLNDKGFNISGSATLKASLPADSQADVLISHFELAFREPVAANVEAVCGFEVAGEPAGQMGLPERDGRFKLWPLAPGGGGAGRFELGNAAKGPVACNALGIPVVGLMFGAKEAPATPPALQLSVAADPYCGGYLQAGVTAAATQVALRTTYTGSVVPLRTERRTLALEFNRGGADGIVRSFYRTIPEIQPGAPWLQGIHLVYYDYLSQKGEGWFKDLKALADRIPAAQRGGVAVCLHGWYDYFQHYAYDHKTGKLLKEWTAFPGTYKVPMSLTEMHRRLKFAKGLGFRVLLYFCDGTNSDEGAPDFNKDYVLKDKTGKTFPGWKGPDSLGQPWMMDPSMPGLRDWYRGYMKALLDEYARDVDGLVWDETFYIPVDFISYGPAGPAYADRAMMSLVGEMTRMVQSYRDRNPDLVLLAADNGTSSCALVAHGTYQDSGAGEQHWGPSMFANYRNSFWSCNWCPVTGAANNQIAAEKYGLPQGVSNGWGDNCGPSQMPPELLDAVLKRFTKNVESKRQHLRYLAP